MEGKTTSQAIEEIVELSQKHGVSTDFVLEVMRHQEALKKTERIEEVLQKGMDFLTEKLSVGFQPPTQGAEEFKWEEEFKI